MLDLEIEGRWPTALSGTYLRTGPNPFGDPGENYHWFLGDGMVHGIRLGDGRAVGIATAGSAPTGARPAR